VAGSNPRQAAVIAMCHTVRGMEVCLIRRKDSTSWSIPKGFIDPGDTAAEAALTEAHEEAGLQGRLLGGPIGTYRYQKGNALLTVAVFLMEVLVEEPSWDEMSFRERRWCSLDESRTLLADHPVRHLLDRLPTR
jgi:8-oxo-dGTP pyrophosphatase MutT (NUDIX family)